MKYKVLKNGFVDENTLRETIQENIKTNCCAKTRNLRMS